MQNGVSTEAKTDTVLQNRSSTHSKKSNLCAAQLICDQSVWFEIVIQKLFIHKEINERRMGMALHNFKKP